MTDSLTTPVSGGTFAPSPQPEVTDKTPASSSDAETPDTELEADAPQQGDDDQSEEASQDDTEEVDHDGKKYRIPKALKSALMMNADYTRKTQELSREREVLGVDRQSVAQQRQAIMQEVEGVAELLTIRKQMQEIKSLDLNTIAQNDPALAQRIQWQYTQAQDQEKNLIQTLQEKQSQRALSEQQATAKQVQEAMAKLPQVIPDWSPELDRKLADFGTANGLSRETLFRAAIENPFYLKVLNDARQWSEHLAKQKVAARAASLETARPIQEVSTRSPAARNPDRMSTEEWMKAETARMKKAGRLR